MRHKIMAATALGFVVAGAASADVCYFKIESLDWDQLVEDMDDSSAVADPNFDAISAAEQDAVSAHFAEAGEDALTTAPGLYAGSSMSNGIWYRKGPCEVGSVRQLANYYDARFTNGLDYRFEKVSESLFERANGPRSEQCEDCYEVHASRQ